MGFHHNYQYLEPGDVVHAGNWGRLIQGFGARHSLFLRETLWEWVREAEFPLLPSRLTAAYFYEDVSAAERGMRDGDPSLSPNLYKVEVVDQSLTIHRADLELWEQAWATIHRPQEFAEVARSYWRGDTGGGRFECLTNSDLRVVDVIERSKLRPGIQT